MFPETVPDNPFLDPGIPSINEPPDRRSPHAELELANDKLELDNDQLLTENSRLRERLEEGNANGRAIPDWAIDELTSNFSLMGLLLARLQSRCNQPLLRDELRGALFQRSACAGRSNYTEWQERGCCIMRNEGRSAYPL